MPEKIVHATPDGQPARLSPIIRLVDLHKSFGPLSVLKGISIDFQRGRTTVVLGPSGCGKSVLLKHIVGLLRPDSGEVWFEEVRIDREPEAKLGDVRRQIGFLFQQSALFDSMSVGENIRFPLRELSTMKPAAIEGRIHEVLAMVGLEDTVGKMPAELSGGQRKRIALARAIVLKPTVILYDEPTTGLDPIRADVINELILKLQRDMNVTSIIVTHDLSSAFKLADEMVMLHEGRVVVEGPPDVVRRSTIPVVQRFLAGEATDEELAGILNAQERTAMHRHPPEAARR
jgi:phospholipid/cholesterol/gamma-HCH transport system ATP-binding protein